MRRISGLGVKATPMVNHTGLSIPSDFASENLLPVGASLKFDIGVESGDVEYYLVQMNNQLYKVCCLLFEVLLDLFCFDF